MTIASLDGVQAILGRFDSEPFTIAILGLMFVLIAYGLRRLNSIASPKEQDQPFGRTQIPLRQPADLLLGDVRPRTIEIPRTN